MKYDLIIVGSSFAGSFFLNRFLELQPKARVLVLERGRRESHAWRIQNRHLLHTSGILSSTPLHQTFVNKSPEKPWIYTPSFGGSSNCWWACTPRFHPNDFKLKSRYGVGRDWPIEYHELEPYYCQAERVMAVSGSTKYSPAPRSEPFPQPPHLMNDAWRILHNQQPNHFFPMPTARARLPTTNRSACCASGVCALCPVDAKFTILNELASLYDDPRTTLTLEAQAIAVDISGSIATGVRYNQHGKERTAHGDLIVLAANPIFNAHILLHSGVTHPLLGCCLADHVGYLCTIDLNGIEGMNGSTSGSGHGYCWYDGEHRRERASCLIESSNIGPMRIERGKYGQRMMIKFVFEDIPNEASRVGLSDDPNVPTVSFAGHSQYVTRAAEHARTSVEELVSTLPVEHIDFATEANPTEGHIMGTALMGDDVAISVVDKHQLLHTVRNLVVAGGSSFPSIAAANPTLTIAALSLWSAERLAQ